MFKYVSYIPTTDAFTTHIFNEKNDKCRVHRFDVPYVSVECDNESDFTELMEYQNDVINATEITLEEFESLVLHSDQVNRMYDIANEQYKNDMKPMTDKYSTEEIASWPAQTTEAKAILSGSTEKTPYIDAVVIDTGATHAEGAQKILNDKGEYDAFDAEAISNKRAKLNELKIEVGLGYSNAGLFY